MERKEIVTRSAQNPKDCWAVEDIFPTEAAWEAEWERIVREAIDGQEIEILG